MQRGLLIGFCFLSFGCGKDDRRDGSGGGPLEVDIARVLTGYRDANEVNPRSGDAKADDMFRGSRIVVEGEVKSSSAIYMIHNPDVKTTRQEVAEIGSKIDDPRGVLDSYRVNLVRIKGRGNWGDEVTASFQLAEGSKIRALKEGDSIKAVGVLSHGTAGGTDRFTSI